MKAITLDKPFANEEEYFAFEERSELKHEYINGTLFEMSGASIEHNFIIVNLVYLLKPLALAKKKQLNVDGYKVRTPDGNFLYPDIILSVPKGNKHYKDNPIFVVEVLSDSTRAYDLSDKFIQYRKCPTLEYYMCIEPEKRRIFLFYRNEDSDWLMEEVGSGDNDIINLPKLYMSLAVKDIYSF
jgi:Uma2 family endonuclease